MKKRITAILLALMLMMSTLTAMAYSRQEKTADALNELGLLLGTGKGYELSNKLNRAEGVTMLIRMIGKDEAAKNWNGAKPFTDVLPWAQGYVSYAAANGITNGTNLAKGEFSPNAELSDYMFLTLVLRALGYSDQGSNAVFVWNNPYGLAKIVGLIDKAEADTYFTRGDAVEVLWRAMNARLSGKGGTLSESLIAQGVFTKAAFESAAKVQQNGRSQYQGVPRPEDTGSTGNTGSGNSGGTGGSGAGNTSDTGKMTFEKYESLSGAEQQAYFNSFKDPAAFFAWYNAAKAEYEASQDRIEIGNGGSVDMDKIINSKN